MIDQEVVVKLSSGEEVFALLKEVTETQITLEEPMKIFRRYVEGERGMTIQLNFEPFFDYLNTKSVIIPLSFVMICEPLVQRLSELYSEMRESTRSFLPEGSEDSEAPGTPVVQGNITLH